MGQVKELDKHVTWAGIVGKYFTAIAVLDATDYKLVYDSHKMVDGFDHSAISFERPALKSAKTTDTFRFYMGPMKKEILANYNDSVQECIRHCGPPRGRGGHLVHSHRMAGDADEVNPGLLLPHHPQLWNRHHTAHDSHESRLPAADFQELGINGQDGHAESEDGRDPGPSEGQAGQDEPGDLGAVPAGKNQPAFRLSAAPPADAGVHSRCTTCWAAISSCVARCSFRAGFRISLSPSLC